MNWYERGKNAQDSQDNDRSKRADFEKHGPGSNMGRSSHENKTAMHMIRIRQRSELGDFFFELVKVLGSLVEKSAGLENFQRTIRESPDLGFTFTKVNEAGDEPFRVECDFKIANDYLKVKVNGMNDGASFKGRVNMFMSDTLFKIAHRIADQIPSHDY